MTRCVGHGSCAAGRASAEGEREGLPLREWELVEGKLPIADAKWSHEGIASLRQVCRLGQHLEPREPVLTASLAHGRFMRRHTAKLWRSCGRSGSRERRGAGQRQPRRQRRGILEATVMRVPKGAAAVKMQHRRGLRVFRPGPASAGDVNRWRVRWRTLGQVSWTTRESRRVTGAGGFFLRYASIHPSQR